MKRILFILLILSRLSVSFGRAADEITIDPQITLQSYRSPGRVVCLRDGRFACVSKGRYQTSTDQGRTWGSHTTIPEGPGPKINSGLLVEDANGRLVLVYRDDAGMKLQRTPDNRPLPGAKLQIWCVRSADGGTTWSEQQILIHGFCGAMIDAICTRENRLVIPLQELRYEPPRHVTVVFSSDDGGASWHRSEDLDIGGNGIEDGSFEPTVTQRPDGSLLMFLRTTRDRIWSSVSDDGGKSWSDPEATTIEASNSPSFLLALASGRLALVWNPVGPTDGRDWPRRIKPRYAIQPDSVYREEMLLAFSQDGGATWTNPQVIAKQPGGKLRYAYMFEQPAGNIWLNLRGRWLTFSENAFAKQ